MASTLAAGRCTTGASSGRGMQYTIAVVQHSINTCTPDTSEGDSLTADLLEPLELLGALVAARSPNPPGDERAAAGVVREAARALGLPQPEEYRRSAERPNLLIRIGAPGPGSPRLMLVGHLDTMPPGNLSSWQTDPYELTRADGRLAGLGVADMKSGVAAALLAAGRLVADPGWPGGLDLLFLADEEDCSY